MSLVLEIWNLEDHVKNQNKNVTCSIFSISQLDLTKILAFLFQIFDVKSQNIALIKNSLIVFSNCLNTTNCLIYYKSSPVSLVLEFEMGRHV